jgi:hypothetical protein
VLYADVFLFYFICNKHVISPYSLFGSFISTINSTSGWLLVQLDTTVQ